MSLDRPAKACYELDIFKANFPSTPEQVPRSVLNRIGPLYKLSGWIELVFYIALRNDHPGLFVTNRLINHQIAADESDLYYDDEFVAYDEYDVDDYCGNLQEYKRLNNVEIHFRPNNLALAISRAFDLLRAWTDRTPVSTAGPEVEAKTPDNADSALANQSTPKSEGDKNSPAVENNENGGIPKPPNGEDFAPSVDFRSLKWFGDVYEFTPNQAPVVKMLYEHWVKGTPDVGGDTLLATVDPNNPPKRMSVLFQDHPAWKSLIVSGGTKGAYRFAEPPAKNS